jgi:hypothetical protein
MPAQAGDVSADGIGRAFADLALADVHAAHAGMRAERHEGRSNLVDVAFAQAEFFLG